MTTTTPTTPTTPATPFYYFGEACSSHDPRDLGGEAWESRLRCWKAAQDAFHPALAAFADRAAEESSSARLDRAEREFFGSPVTGGTWPKRQRFWRFISLISRGITPRDLKGSQIPSPPSSFFPAPPRPDDYYDWRDEGGEYDPRILEWYYEDKAGAKGRELCATCDSALEVAVALADQARDYYDSGYGIAGAAYEYAAQEVWDYISRKSRPRRRKRH